MEKLLTGRRVEMTGARGGRDDTREHEETGDQRHGITPPCDDVLTGP